MKKTLVFIGIVFSCVVCGFAQTNLVDTARSENDTMRSAQSGFAEAEFRRGVQSYYRGSFNESILEFEKALSYLPGENLILDWLGKAYYRAGIEGAALDQWKFASESGYGGILLQNRIEIVGDRRITQAQYGFTQHYTESGSFPNVNGNVLIYSQPISALPNSDGSIWVVAYGTNEIVRYDVNGLVLRHIRGPINGFDRPMDIIRLRSGNLLLSESAGDRLALLDQNGSFIKYYGKKGRGEGEVIGPQYLAEDSFGNIYVTDFGNARVVVFDEDGNGLLHFGGKAAGFAGLKSPTGIAVVDDRVFVADSVAGTIYEFDRAGNFIGNLVAEKTFARPESLKQWGDYLILADKNRIVTVDIETGATYENGRTPRAGSSVTSAIPDSNGNLIVTDFKGNEIYVMSKMTELVGGFFVQIERVIADQFPTVTLEVRVENRRRQPIVGLNETNFLITEDKHTVSNMKLLGSANNNDIADITILLDRSIEMRSYEEQVNGAVQEIMASVNPSTRVAVISVGDIPVPEYTGSPANLSDFSVRALQAPYTQNGAMDLAMRLAANDLINGEKKRGIIYITSGTVSQDAFVKYSLSDISAYLNNNSIAFSTVMLEQTAPSDEILYLTDNTLGQSYYVYRPEGLAAVVQDIIAQPSGLYQLSYTSALGTEYGKKYLPVEVETYLLNRSGKDESGYFAPLE